MVDIPASIKTIVTQQVLYHSLDEVPQEIKNLGYPGCLKILEQLYDFKNLKQSWLMFLGGAPQEMVANNKKALDMDPTELAKQAPFTNRCFPFMVFNYLDAYYIGVADAMNLTLVKKLMKAKMLHEYFMTPNALMLKTAMNLAIMTALLLACKDLHKINPNVNLKKWVDLLNTYRKLMRYHADFISGDNSDYSNQKYPNYYDENGDHK